MLLRSLWTGLFALLAWMPIGHIQSRALDADGADRALFAVSALDVAVDSPARIAPSQTLPRVLAPDRRPPAPHGLYRLSDAEGRAGSTISLVRPPAKDAQPTGWRGFRPKRLILPHDANAPPPRTS
jgi:hypothetical protein